MNDEAKPAPPSWTLKPGDSIRRVELHERYGGSRYSGISPSRATPNILVFSEPARGEKHGYFDNWKPDGYFHYTGEGQHGDQRMDGGNKAILQHRADGRAIRLFDGAGGTVKYQGEFDVASDTPWYYTDAPETGAPDIVRQVIVFRLKPRDVTAPPVPHEAKSQIREVPVEEQNTERVYVQPGHEPYEAERREQKLVHAYRDFMQKKGARIVRHRLEPTGEAKPIFSDLYDATHNHLIEAKGSGTREAIRMAIGQLADYRRFIEPRPQCAVLLPSRPRLDLEALLVGEGLAAIWPQGDGTFVDNLGGRFTSRPN